MCLRQPAAGGKNTLRFSSSRRQQGRQARGGGSKRRVYSPGADDIWIYKSHWKESVEKGECAEQTTFIFFMKVGFIGAGRMATALCKGFISAALVKPSEILASDINRSKLRSVRELGVETSVENLDVVQNNEIIYLAVKPYIVPEILREIAPAIGKHHLIVSVAAGITIKTIEASLPQDARVVRVMPNTPAVVQSACCVFARGQHVEDDDADRVTEMLNCVGLVEEMPENLMDAVTGLSGNGPAYGFVMIQALADGGVKMGLNRDQSIRLAAQSLLGAAKMIIDTRSHPESLKDEVCSPGGTSAHAIHAMEKAGFRGALIDAVQAGTLRSAEIGKGFNGQD